MFPALKKNKPYVDAHCSVRTCVGWLTPFSNPYTCIEIRIPYASIDMGNGESIDAQSASSNKPIELWGEPYPVRDGYGISFAHDIVAYHEAMAMDGLRQRIASFYNGSHMPEEQCPIYGHKLS